MPRWKRFVAGDEEMWMKNTEKFTQATGIPVRIDSESWEDVRPKAAVAANVSSGPDIILSTFDDALLYPEKLLDVTDVADYLGAKYGGWYDVCEKYLKHNGHWVALPLGCAGNCLVMRDSHMFCRSVTQGSSSYERPIKRRSVSQASSRTLASFAPSR